ncbi:unnamed protein product [Moneuplotes crassus]|uniref:Cyclic nucleotide-binding domain-containing protein n=1 Tax=Euplotes crassus TaxID=5936 RepID=A0AAD1U3D6_EUPCR|nr:unnamed protein product [Moneuplotes crassus]
MTLNRQSSCEFVHKNQVKIITLENKDGIEETKYQELVTLSKGAHFGEVALSKSITRNASVRCEESCKFAALNKDCYNKVIDRIMKKKTNQKIDLIKQIPYFKDWSKVSLTKFCYDHEYFSYKRKQVVFEEGQSSSYVYIVKEGEFELTKKIRYQKDNRRILKDLFKSHCETKYTPVRIPYPGSFLKEARKSMHKITTNMKSNIAQLAKSSSCKMSILSPYQLFGHEDSFRGRTYSTTCTCTVDGILFRIKSSFFERDIRQLSEGTYARMIEDGIQKEKKTMDFLNTKSYIHQRMSSPEMIMNRKSNGPVPVNLFDILPKEGLHHDIRLAPSKSVILNTKKPKRKRAKTAKKRITREVRKARPFSPQMRNKANQSTQSRINLSHKKSKKHHLSVSSSFIKSSTSYVPHKRLIS